MQVIRAVGREAASRKYDILSAMMAYGLAGDKHRQRLILRLMSLITTRYNWQRNELTMGQREIARLWCVDERTVKRDMARLRASEWIDIKRQGARGRVSVIGINFERIMLDTRPQWQNIGDDFIERVAGPVPAADNTVVPFRRPDVTADGGLWNSIRRRLAAEDPALFDAWFAGLADGGVKDGCLILIAPTRFHATYAGTHLMGRLQTAMKRDEQAVDKIRIEWL